MFGSTLSHEKRRFSQTSLLASAALVALSLSGAGASQAASPQTASDPIPLGTKITTANWEQYKQFMPDGMQALWSGKYFWKIPAKAVLEVGPTVKIGVPTSYQNDTEKYGGQAKLVPVPSTGGYKLQGYVSGQPFPRPSGPDLGLQVFYNYYYRYLPRFHQHYWNVHFLDRYGNSSGENGFSIYTKFSHLSTPGFPTTDPRNPGIYFTLFQEVLGPEQSKYTAQLLIYYDDVTRVEENYVFVPSLRRSLRLSSSARCAPILGTDWTPEDVGGFNGVPSYFTAEYKGERKILSLQHGDPRYIAKPASYYSKVFWPKPEAGMFELRDSYVINLKRTPATSKGYCYGARIMYIDKETYASLWVDTYDRDLKLYKVLTNFRTPVWDPDVKTMVVPDLGQDLYANWDMQNRHFSGSFEEPVLLDSDVPAQYRDISHYATPAGLDQVMQ